MHDKKLKFIQIESEKKIVSLPYLYKAAVRFIKPNKEHCRLKQCRSIEEVLINNAREKIYRKFIFCEDFGIIYL
jgi:S-ribosylhomocysteine lyase LuxS involved in autoinducer biosynthesis